MVAVLIDKKTSLHKHKMGAHDSMLGYIWYQLVTEFIMLENIINFKHTICRFTIFQF